MHMTVTDVPKTAVVIVIVVVVVVVVVDFAMENYFLMPI